MVEIGDFAAMGGDHQRPLPGPVGLEPVGDDSVAHVIDVVDDDDAVLRGW